MNRAILILTFLCCIFCIEYTTLAGDARTVAGYTSQAISVPTPFHRAFKLQVQAQNDFNYVFFQANRLQTEEKSRYFIEGKDISVLEYLRSASAEEYQQILVYDDFIMILKDMREVMILKEKKNTFKMLHKFEIQEINYGTSLYRAYPFKQKAVLFSGDEAYLLHDKGYYSRLAYENQERGRVAHAVWVEGTDYILVAEYSQGLSVYQIDQQNNKTKHIHSFKASFFNLSHVSIEDVSLRHAKDGKMYVLDSLHGLFQMSFDIKDINSSKLLRRVTTQQNCKAVDSIDVGYFVLSCIYGNEDHFLSEVLLNKDGTITILSPIFKDHYIVDIEVSEDYYLSLSRKTIDVHWNSQKHHLPDNFRDTTPLVIPGTELIHISKSNSKYYLYTINNGYLTKYELTEVGPRLQFKSQQPLQTSFNISVYGSCEYVNTDVYKSNVLINLESIPKDKQFCIYNGRYDLKINREVGAEKSDISASVSVVIILLVVLLMLIWVCLKKYKKLEREARRMLDEFKNHQHRPLSL